ncbi:hypothetical protein B4U80_02192 [Leptotrombidium deliense]|uniref:Uncharacterized protein n=1 Tax=Leptotrombidium deliense TaxID=299467 RepID=A0A443SKY2_9ACAR|nr:hypothetical protein B4U80_02192 [Leptotrombidium deliense]
MSTNVKFGLHAIQSLCDIENGENVVILEIQESLASQINQTTEPNELPINGLENQISLAIQSETHRYFDLQGKRLVLNKPLDRDVRILS